MKLPWEFLFFWWFSILGNLPFSRKEILKARARLTSRRRHEFQILSMGIFIAVTAVFNMGRTRSSYCHGYGFQCRDKHR